MMFTHGPHRDHTSRTCKGCRYWSEMVAMSGPETGGVLKALCLNPESPRHGGYVAARETCAQWRIGHLGAVDEPGSNGDEYAIAARTSRFVCEADRCEDCARLTRNPTRPNLAYCSEGWPGEEGDEPGVYVSCVMFVLRGSARDTGSAG